MTDTWNVLKKAIKKSFSTSKIICANWRWRSVCKKRNVWRWDFYVIISQSGAKQTQARWISSQTINNTAVSTDARSCVSLQFPWCSTGSRIVACLELVVDVVHFFQTVSYCYSGTHTLQIFVRPWGHSTTRANIILLFGVMPCVSSLWSCKEFCHRQEGTTQRFFFKNLLAAVEGVVHKWFTKSSQYVCFRRNICVRYNVIGSKSRSSPHIWRQQQAASSGDDGDHNITSPNLLPNLYETYDSCHSFILALPSFGIIQVPCIRAFLPRLLSHGVEILSSLCLCNFESLRQFTQ